MGVVFGIKFDLNNTLGESKLKINFIIEKNKNKKKKYEKMEIFM